MTALRLLTVNLPRFEIQNLWRELKWHRCNRKSEHAKAFWKMNVLRNFVLVPRAGLGNRLRAIASARRLCARCGIKCVVVWNWGDFHQLFISDPAIECIPQLSRKMKQDWVQITHRHSSKGGCPNNWRVPLTLATNVVLFSFFRLHNG